MLQFLLAVFVNSEGGRGGRGEDGEHKGEGTKVMNTLYLVNNFGDPLGGGFSFVDMKFPELTIFIRSELYCHVHRVRLFFPFKITGLYRKGP